MITETKIDVRYPDCDAMGIVHHAVYPIWYEIARMDFFAKVGFSYSDMNALGINPPMVNLNLQYKSPVRYPGRVIIRTACTLCAGKKLELRYSVYPEGKNTPAATATSFHVWTGPDMKSLDLRTLPETYEHFQSALAHTAVLILAGGKSSRMHTDKAKAMLGGETMLERAVRFWKTQLPAAPIYIATGTAEHFETLPEGVTPINDLVSGCGPMSGLQSAFTVTEESQFVISAVDMPFLSGECLQMLVEQDNPCSDLCVFQHDGRSEPLFGFYRKSVLPLLNSMMKEGNYRMTALVAAACSTLVPIDSLKSLHNTNTPEEFSQAQKILEAETNGAAH